MNINTMIKRAVAVAAAVYAPAAFPATPWTHLNYQNDPDEFQFAIIPDRAGGDYRGAFSNALAKVNMMHPEFVITVGDLVQGGTPVEPMVRKQQIELTNMTAKVAAPFFTVVGNHDIGRSRAYPPGYERSNEETTALWREFYGDDTYYSFVYKNVLFVCLNTVEGRDTRPNPCGITAEQYAWFKKTLDAHRDVRWTMIFMHQPAVWLTSEWLKFEKEELVKRPYTVFAGDWHTYLHARRHGRDYYVLAVAGGGSGMNAAKSRAARARLMGPEYGEVDHITWVTMTKNGPELANLVLDGVLPGDFMDQSKTLWTARIDPLDYPVDSNVVARLRRLKDEASKKADKAFAGGMGMRQGDETGFTLYNVTAFSPGREYVAALDAEELQSRTGVDLALYCLSLHPEGVPAIDKARRLVDSFRTFKRLLAGKKVRAGVLVQSIIGHWARPDRDLEPWTRTLDSSGRVKRFCPLDPGFAQYITDVFTMIAEEHPAFVLTDDDVRGYSHDAECFCERHMALFNERRGTHYTADELRGKLAKARQDDPDYVAFLAMQREMVESVVRRARAAMDAVDPSIPAGICVAGEEHLFCVPLARAIAAKGQRPVMRAATGLYGETMSAASYPVMMNKLLGFAERYGNSGVSMICEADSCPHNIWSKSAMSLLAHTAAAAFAGFSGAKTWYVNGHKGEREISRNYTDILAENPLFLPEIARTVAGSEWEGLAVPCFTNCPAWHLVGNHRQFFTKTVGGAGDTLCVPFGVPYHMSGDFGNRDKVFVLASEEDVLRMTDDEARRILSGKVLVLRPAVCALSRRGFSRLTGVSAEADASLVFTTERDMMNGAKIAFTAMDGSFRFRADPKAEILSVLGYSPYHGSTQFEEATPSAVLFHNELGGSVLSVQYHAEMFGLHRYSEARKAWLLSALERLAGAPVPFVSAIDQNMLVLLRRAAGGDWIVMAVNLNSDPVKKMSFFPPASGVGQVERLCGDGKWRRVPFELNEGRIVCDIPLSFYEAVVLRAGGGK